MRYAQKTGHLFRNIFLILCLLLACLLAYLTVFMTHYVRQEQVRALDRANLQILETCSSRVDQVAENLEEKVQLLLSESAVTQYLLAPQVDGQGTGMEILQLLKTHADLSADVSQMWLYAPLSGTVLSSDGYLTGRDSSFADILLRRYEAREIPRSDPDRRLDGVIYGGKVYIFIEFAPSVTLGCFIFEIDPQNLGLDSAEDLQLVDSDGSLLLRGGQLPEQSQNFDLGDETIFYADGATQRTTQQLYYKVDNNTFHWSLLLPLGDASQSIAYDALRWQLPTLLGLILFGLAAAYFITRAIYAPIYRLCQVVSERSGTSLSGQQELDYLEDAYQQTLQDNDQLQTQVSELGRDTRQYLCRAAIRGELRPGADVDHLLESLPEGELQVAIVRPGEAGETLPVELGTLTGQLSECLCALSEPPNGLVLILCPPPEGVGERLKAWLKQASGATGCPLLCGLGKAKGLYQLKDSYEEAVYDLQYNAYQAAEGDNAPEEMELGQNLAGKKKYYYVEEGKRFIRDNYQNPALSVNDICAHVGITPSYFSSLFNELTQESVTSYLNRIRVEQAKIMLLQTRTPVKDIGTQCGFNSPNGFGRVFKRYTDQSPKQFRDSQRSISEVAYDD